MTEYSCPYFCAPRSFVNQRETHSSLSANHASRVLYLHQCRHPCSYLRPFTSASFTPFSFPTHRCYRSSPPPNPSSHCTALCSNFRGAWLFSCFVACGPDSLRPCPCPSKIHRPGSQPREAPSQGGCNDVLCLLVSSLSQSKRDVRQGRLV